METVDETEAPSSPFECEVCHRPFDSRDEVVQHWRDNHSAAARRAREGKTSPPSTKGRRTATRRSSPGKTTSPQQSPVQTGLTLTYALIGQGFGMFGPEPAEARMAVSQSIMMTAAHGGYALDRIARRTPVYKYLNGFFGAAGVLEDATPLGIPLIVGMYAYAPDQAKDALRPMAGTLLGLLLLQTFGPEPPAMPEDATPVALPEWIRQFVDGLLPRAKVTTTTPEPMPQAPAA